MSSIKWICGMTSGLLLGLGQYAWAHERWVPNSLLNPVNAKIFTTLSWDMLSVVGRSFLIFALIVGIWSIRNPIQALMMRLSPQRWRGFSKGLSDFMFDEAVQADWFRCVSQYLNKFAVRVPAIVLMYSAATDALMMPSFPLPPGSDLFKYAQVAMGLLILMELLLPVVGYTLIGLFGYVVVAYGPIVSVDALPLLALAYVYITMPRRSGARALTIRHNQVIWMRIIVGVSFALLGIMKLWNSELTIGVADHAPVVMSDPLIRLFWLGTDPQYAREWWALGFALSEILTGVLVVTGIFKRIISFSVSLVFTKLMIYDMGWQEIPHLYPISILIMVCFSNIAVPTTADPQRRARDDTPSQQADPDPINLDITWAEPRARVS